MATEKHGKTLFIRNLSYSTTNDELEQIFSDIGPVKSCFVVSDKDSQKCRGFGYVKFTMLEDAEKALKSVTSVNGRKVQIMYANKKEKKKKGFERKEDQKSNIQERLAQLVKDPSEIEEESKPLKKEVVKEKQIIVKEKPVRGEKQKTNPKTEGKRARLIIRNLSFKCSKEQVKEAFSKHGQVLDVHIPKKGDGKRFGFGFVQMANKAQAGMVMKALNGKELSGRVVAVDWALPKDKFESKTESQETNTESMEVDGVEDGEMDDDDDDEDDDEDDENDKGMSKDESKMESEESEGSESEDQEDEDDDDEEESGSNDSEEDEDKATADTKKKVLITLDRKSDTDEGKTLFIRSLPYSVEEEEVQEFFSQFGDVKYVKLVIDHASGIPKGSAFVQYKAKESAESCLESSGETSLNLGGRDLFVSMAVSRREAGEIIEKEKKKEKKDTRNLYLAREGMIRPGTEAAHGVADADLTKRATVDATKRKKLKDQNVFVSSVRLCVHNLPATVTDQQLKVVCAKAAGDRAAKLTECRIMRDLNRVNAQGVGKSRGYAFCAFTQHEHALAALQHMNNNPDVFGNNKRLIVEFSLENRKALEAKEKRLEKSRSKLKHKPNPHGPRPTNFIARKKWQRGKLQATDTKPLVTRKQQDKVARSLHKGPLGLPVHSGAKQRHNPRPDVKAKDKKQTRLHQPQQHNNKNNINHQKEERPAKMKKFKKKQDTDSFDRLVASYKTKIMKSVKL